MSSASERTLWCGFSSLPSPWNSLSTLHHMHRSYNRRKALIRRLSVARGSSRMKLALILVTKLWAKLISGASEVLSYTWTRDNTASSLAIQQRRTNSLVSPDWAPFREKSFKFPFTTIRNLNFSSVWHSKWYQMSSNCTQYFLLCNKRRQFWPHCLVDDNTTPTALWERQSAGTSEMGFMTRGRSSLRMDENRCCRRATVTRFCIFCLISAHWTAKIWSHLACTCINCRYNCIFPL